MRPESTRCLTRPLMSWTQTVLYVPVFEVTALTAPHTHTSHPLMLSAASPLFDDKQVLILWVHLLLKFLVSNPELSSPPLPLSFLWLWLARLHLSSPTGIVWSSVSVSFWWHRRNLLRFPLPPLLLHLYGFSFDSASGKVICFIQNEFTRCVSWGGHRTLGFPSFHIAGAFMLFVFICFGCRNPHFIAVIKKDVGWVVVVVVRAFVRRMVRLMVVFMMADFLFLLWRSRSERGLRTGRENAILLQIWGKRKQKRLIFFFFFCLMYGWYHSTVSIKRQSEARQKRFLIL